MVCIEECISEIESRKVEGDFNTKVKLDIYTWFDKSVEFKKYLHGIVMQEVDFCLSLDRVHTV